MHTDSIYAGIYCWTGAYSVTTGGQMTEEVELFQDDKGIAVIGSTAAIDAFLSSHGLSGTEMQMSRLTQILQSTSGISHAASQLAEQSGRWVQITEKSAKALKQAKLMKGSTDGVSRAVIMKDGKINGLVEIVTRPGSFLTNPAMLGGIAGIMSQMAMQQAMNDINKYLASIDHKIEKVLQNQKDSLVSGLVGLNFQLREALTVRNETGEVSDITWSKIQNSTTTIAQAQAYVLRQLEVLVEELNLSKKLPGIAKSLKKTEPQLGEWLALLAYSFQLQDGVSIIELDRVLTSSSNQLESHRRALLISRQQRLEQSVHHTARIQASLHSARQLAQDATFRHPSLSREVVETANRMTALLESFHTLFTLTGEFEQVEAKGWWTAATELRDGIVSSVKERVDSIQRTGEDVLGAAKVLGSALTEEVSRIRQIESLQTGASTHGVGTGDDDKGTKDLKKEFSNN